MEWFKHATGSHEDPDISDAWDTFGDSGPLLFWIILEVFGAEYSHLKNDWLTLSVAYFERKTRRKFKKSEKILEFFQNRERIYFKKDQQSISLTIPKFIKIASNWTIRPRAEKPSLPTEAPTEAPTAKEEEEKKKRREEDIIPPLVDDKSPTCPHEEIISLYHKILPELPAVKIWTQKRQAHLRSRWKESSERQCLEWWEKYFQKIKQSPFLTGNVTDFKASLEWVVNQSNMVKILEGKYDGGNGNGGIRTARSDPRDKTLQPQWESEVAAIIARREAAKQSARSHTGGDATTDDAPDFSNAGLTG
jgi:hypothetical protein